MRDNLKKSLGNKYISHDIYELSKIMDHHILLEKTEEIKKNVFFL